jgi:hypothetical protein
MSWPIEFEGLVRTELGRHRGEPSARDLRADEVISPRRGRAGGLWRRVRPAESGETPDAESPINRNADRGRRSPGDRRSTRKPAVGP